MTTLQNETIICKKIAMEQLSFTIFLNMDLLIIFTVKNSRIKFGNYKEYIWTISLFRNSKRIKSVQTYNFN